MVITQWKSVCVNPARDHSRAVSLLSPKAGERRREKRVFPLLLLPAFGRKVISLDHRQPRRVVFGVHLKIEKGENICNSTKWIVNARNKSCLLLLIVSCLINFRLILHRSLTQSLHSVAAYIYEPLSLRFVEIYNELTGDKRIEISWNKACLPSAQCSPVRPGRFEWHFVAFLNRR